MAAYGTPVKYYQRHLRTFTANSKLPLCDNEIDMQKYILHYSSYRIISDIFLRMLLSKTRANIEESVYNSPGKETRFPEVAERIMSVFVKRKMKGSLNQSK